MPPSPADLPAPGSPTDAHPAPAPEAAIEGSAQIESRPPWRSTVRFMQRFLRALVNDATYDVRRNPSLWVGFVMALPIPFFVWTAGAPTWLLLLSLPAPIFWGVVLGAAGHVGMQAVLRAQRLEEEIAQTRSEAEAEVASIEEALDQEVSLRTDLQARQDHVESELKLAAAVHGTLVPNDIMRPEVEVAVRQIPSQVIGGDYLYASVAGSRYLYLCVGDVSGHGMSAAIVVARLHGLIRRLTFAKRSRPVTLLEHLNQAALQILKHTYFFMTFAVFRLDLETGRLGYATAGHPAQVLLRKSGKVEELRTRNRLLGIDDAIFDPNRPSRSVTMKPGDTLVLFTDGLFEILSGKDGEILGEDGLHERIASLRDLSPSMMAGEILQELADFQGSSTFDDDVSLMVMTYRGRRRDVGDAPPGVVVANTGTDAPVA